MDKGLWGLNYKKEVGGLDEPERVGRAQEMSLRGNRGWNTGWQAS